MLGRVAYPLAIVAAVAALLWLAVRLAGLAYAAAVRRRIRHGAWRGRGRTTPPTIRSVFRARPWRGGPGPAPPEYNRPPDLVIDDEIPPPPRAIDGVYGE